MSMCDLPFIDGGLSGFTGLFAQGPWSRGAGIARAPNIFKTRGCHSSLYSGFDLVQSITKILQNIKVAPKPLDRIFLNFLKNFSLMCKQF